MKTTVLIIDDEKNIRELFKEALGGNYNVITADSGEKALEIVENKKIQVAFIDKNLPGIDGIETFKRIIAIDNDITGIVITAFGEVKDAVSALKIGVYDYLLKPLKIDEIRLVLKRAIEDKELRKEVSFLRDKVSADFDIKDIIGESEAIKGVKNLIKQASECDASVLIEGESGTGKELVANAIHYNSERKNKPLIEVNCAAIPKDLIEAELFGHEKGAFTGTVGDRKGLFEQADGGTLFLDEIGDMALDTQAKILRAIEGHKFRTVGGTKDIEVDVRIITATNKNLRAMIKEGAFREDLFYRFNVIEIKIPTLSERKEDISLIAQHFVKVLDKRNKISSINESLMNKLQGISWKGNVRELKNAIERMIIGCDDGVLDDMVYDRCFSHAERDLSIEKLSQAVARDILCRSDVEYKNALMEFSGFVEKAVIEGILRKNNGNQNSVSEALGISRQSLYEKIKKYGINVDSFKSDRVK